MDLVTRTDLADVASWHAGLLFPTRSTAEDQALPALSIEFFEAGLVRFRGTLVIPGVRYPEQGFTFSSDGPSVLIENAPENEWPKVSIRLRISLERRTYFFEGISIRPSSDSVTAQVLASRVLWSMAHAGELVLEAEGSPFGVTIRTSVAPLSEPDEKALLYRACVMRKLSFLEHVFSTRLVVPTEISGGEIGRVDEVFRAVTEGEFLHRQAELLITIDPASDMSKPPFTAPGPLHVEFEAPLELFGRQFDLGPFSLRTPVAVLKDGRRARKLFAQGQSPALCFRVFSHHIIERFERYVGAAHSRMRRRLRRFEDRLEREEPNQLAALLREPLVGDLRTEDAQSIAAGWLLLNGFPDGYCPQEPILDEGAGVWRVPIGLAYPTRKARVIGELGIDLGTGEIRQAPSIDALLEQGQRTAVALLNAG
jgi:hypothetical protein